MKLFLLAATAALAMPALAQTMPSTGSPSDPANTTSTGATGPAGQTTASPPPADSSTMPSSGTQPMQSMQPAQPMTTGATSDPVGGYAPTGSALSGTPQPGSTVTVQPSMSPDQAFPAPAPMAKYPVCKKGQYDKCIERGGKK